MATQPPSEDPASAAPTTVDDGMLDAFVTGKQSVHPVRVVLAIATLLIVTFVLWPTRDELLTHFRRAPVRDIADSSSLRVDVDLPLDCIARVHGVLGNRAAKIEGWRRGALRMGPIEVRQVVGAPLFVEFDPARHHLGAFSEAELTGRVTSFGPDTDIPEVREFLLAQGIEIAQNARLLILDEGPGLMTRYLFGWTLGLTLLLLALLSLRNRPRR